MFYIIVLMHWRLQSFPTLCIHADQLQCILYLTCRLEPPACQINNLLYHLPFRILNPPNCLDFPGLCRAVEHCYRKSRPPASTDSWQLMPQWTLPTSFLCPSPSLTVLKHPYPSLPEALPCLPSGMGAKHCWCLEQQQIRKYQRVKKMKTTQANKL